MRTFLAFKYETQVTEDEIKVAIDRVKRHYYETHPINFELEVEYYIHKNIGAVIFDSKDTPLKWKNIAKSENGALITFAPPPNWKKFSTSGKVESAPLELFKELRKNKQLQSKFSTPTCLCTIDTETEELDIFTDPLGFARLYEYKGENGWFWSNRAGAVTLMAGEKAEINKEAWEFFSSAGWFVDTTSPIDNVVRVEPGIRINANLDYFQPRRIFNYGAYDQLISPRKHQKFDAKSIAIDMLENLASYSELWGLPLEVDLSGGKDSRICSAAVIASQAEINQFKTIANLEKEAEVASVLLKKVGLTHKHNIIRSSANKEGKKVKRTPIKERLRTLLHQSDGDLTPILTRKNVNPEIYFRDIRNISIQGALGEIGKATLYSSQSIYDSIIKKGEPAIYDRVTRAYKPPGGVRTEITERANQFIYSIIQKGKTKGISSLYLLDFFYFNERVRRWFPQNLDVNRYSAFYSSKFIEQAFNMSYSEKRNLEIYTSIINELIPEWNDVPFYKRKITDRDERTEKGLRIWQTADRQGIEEILDNPSDWNDMFDENEIHNIWDKAINGEFHPGIESIFDRLVMRASFNAHLDRINDQLEKTTDYKTVNHKSTFSPIDELEMDQDIRLVIFDNKLRKYVLIEVIPSQENYLLDDQLIEESKNLKYKYQKFENGKWRDLTNYIAI